MSLFCCPQKEAGDTAGGSGDMGGTGSSPSSPSHYLIGVADGAGPNEAMIKAALNQQTYEQFSAYAAHQAPRDKRHQQAIITQLQEEHFKQVSSGSSSVDIVLCACLLFI